MAGVSTPELAAAVSNAGGLGFLGIGASDAAGAHAMIENLRALTSRSRGSPVAGSVKNPFERLHLPRLARRSVEDRWLSSYNSV